MSIWADPLDVLIEELEQIAPQTHPAADPRAIFLDVQAMADVILYGSDEARASLQSDPRWLRVLQWGGGTNHQPQRRSVRTAIEASSMWKST